MKFLASVAISFLAVSLWAQNDAELTPREMFYIKAPAAALARPAAKKIAPIPAATQTSAKLPQPQSQSQPQSQPQLQPQPPLQHQPHPPLVPAAFTPLALKYSLLQRKGNRFEEVDSDTEFHSGDRIRVRVETNSTAYLYIVMGGSSGQWRVLFPSKDIAGGDNRIEAGTACTIPPENDPPFYFDETAGIEKVSLVLSRSPEPDLEKLIYAVGDPSRGEPKTIMALNRPIDGAVVGHLRDEVLARDLVFEKYDGATPDGQQEKAVYAATKDQSANARLFVDLKLVHK